MKKIIYSFLLIMLLLLVPCMVHATSNNLPDEVDGVITLTEDITLSEKVKFISDVKIDLNNHVLKLTKADNHFNSKVIIENGTIDISNVSHTDDGIIEVGSYGGITGNLILNNINFIGEDYKSSYAVIYVYGESELDINNSTMNLINEGSSTGGVIKAQGTLGRINIINSTLNFTNTIRGLLDGTLLIKDSDVTIQGTKVGGLDNAINTSSQGLDCTIENTKLNIANANGRGITLDNTTLNIKNKSNITISNCEEGEIYIKTSGTINVDGISYIDAKISQRNGAIGKVSVAGGIFKQEVNPEYIAEGYSIKEINNNYVLAKENEIKVSKNIEQGSIELSKDKAYIEESIKLAVEVNDGYEIEKIELIGLESNSIEIISDNQFTMPNEPVEIKVSFRKFIQELELPTIKEDEQVEEITIGVQNSEEIENILLETLKTDSKLLDIAKFNNVKLNIEVKEENVSEEQEKNIKDELTTLSKNITIAKYVDITIYMKNKETEENLATLSNLNNKIKFKVALPTNLQEMDNIKEYYIVKVHDGKIERLEANLTEDGKFLEFESKEFSLYAIAYSTEEKIGNDNNTDIEDSETDVKDDETDVEDSETDVKDDETDVEDSETDVKDNETDINDKESEEKNDEQEENVIIEDTTKDENYNENKGANPKTGDKIIFYMLLAIISGIGLMFIRKK